MSSEPQVQLSPQQHRGNDFRLLLKNLESAGFDQEGTALVRRSFEHGVFWGDFADDEILGLAAIAQQHGLLEHSHTLFSWLEENRPQCLQAWTAHLEMAQLLGDRPLMLTLLARMSDHYSAEELAQVKRSLRDDISQEDALPKEDPLLDPFKQVRRDEENIALFLSIFRGKEDAFARQWADKEQDKCGYVPVQRPISTDEVREHIQGRKTYGLYLLNNASETWIGVIDVDLLARYRDTKEAKASADKIRREAIYLYKRIKELAAKASLACIAEASGGKGYHFWFPSAEPIAAGIMKKALQALAKAVAGDIGCFSLEVFPKQDSLSGKGFGNLVKLPLGVHRRTGRRSRLIPSTSDDLEQQFTLLRSIIPAPAENFKKIAETYGRATVIMHPRHAEWAEKFPELAMLSSRCSILGQVIAVARSAKALTLREEKVLLGVLPHLPRGRLLLHHIFSSLPEYNRPLLDFKISRVGGTVLGCKRIHTLLDERGGALPCIFDNATYPHPLLHVPGFSDPPQPLAEKVSNLQDALLCLKTAIEQIQRFL